MMACRSLGYDRRAMTISITILGLTLCTVLLAYIAFGNISFLSDTTSVRFAVIIFRHGERSPTGLYPNDPHKDHVWPGGFGSLSPKGALQMYNLGTHLRLRYFRLLPSNSMYSKNNMYVLSSAAERCLMSAQSFLAGFLPPLQNQNKLPILWQPVAVNSIPRDRDKILSQKAVCHKYDELLSQMYTNPPDELKDYYEHNAAVFIYLRNYTGSNMKDIAQAEMLYNILAIEEASGLVLPEWTIKVYPEKLLEMAKRNLALLTETPFMKLVKGGSLVTDIVDKMVSKKNGTLNPDRSLFIYSGHDVTLVNIMRALEVNNQTSTKPDYGATLAMELHHNNEFTDDFEIKILYFFSTDDENPIELSIPNCLSPCSLTKFLASVQHIIIRDYEEMCKK